VYNPTNVAITGGSITGASVSVADTAFTITNLDDPTKKVTFSASGVTTGTTSNITVPGVSGTLAILNAVQTFTATQNINASFNTMGTTSLATGTGGVTNIGSSAIASTTNIGGGAGTSALNVNAATKTKSLSPTIIIDAATTITSTGLNQAFAVTGFERVLYTPASGTAATNTVSSATFTSTAATDLGRNGKLIIEAGSVAFTLVHTGAATANTFFLQSQNNITPTFVGQTFFFELSAATGQWVQISGQNILMDSGGNFIANIVPRTGIHTGGTPLQSLAGGVGEIGSFTDYPGLAQFTSTANQASLYVPNGVQFLTDTPGNAGIGATAVAGTITVQTITGGTINASSATSAATIVLVLPNGQYSNQVLTVVCTIPGVGGVGVSTAVGGSSIPSGYCATFQWSVASAQWTTVQQPTFLYAAGGVNNSGYVIGIGDSQSLSGQNYDIALGYGTSTTGVGQAIVIGQLSFANTNTNTSNGGNTALVFGNASSVANGGTAVGNNAVITGSGGAIFGNQVYSSNNAIMQFGAGNYRAYAYMSHAAGTAVNVELTTNSASIVTVAFSNPPNSTDNRFYPYLVNPVNGAVGTGNYNIKVDLTATITSGANVGTCAKFKREVLFYSAAGTTMTLVAGQTTTTQTVGTDYIGTALVTLGLTSTSFTIGVGAQGQLAITCPGYATTSIKWVAFVESDIMS
jgi:hypothetical protein